MRAPPHSGARVRRGDVESAIDGAPSRGRSALASRRMLLGRLLARARAPGRAAAYAALFAVGCANVAYVATTSPRRRRPRAEEEERALRLARERRARSSATEGEGETPSDARG